MNTGQVLLHQSRVAQEAVLESSGVIRPKTEAVWNRWCQRARSRAAFISMAVWHKVQYATGIGNSQICIVTWKYLQRVSFSVITLELTLKQLWMARGVLRHHHLMMNCRAYKHSTSISTTLVYLCPPSTHLLLCMRVFSSSCLCTAIYTTKHLGKLFIDDQPKNNHLLGLQWLHVLHTLNSGCPSMPCILSTIVTFIDSTKCMYAIYIWS